MNIGLFYYYYYYYYSKVYVIFSVPPDKFLKLDHACFLPRLFQLIYNHPIRSSNIISWYSEQLRIGRSVVRIPEGARDFPCSKTSILTLGPTKPPIQWAPRFFPGGKTAGA